MKLLLLIFLCFSTFSLNAQSKRKLKMELEALKQDTVQLSEQIQIAEKAKKESIDSLTVLTIENEKRIQGYKEIEIELEELISEARSQNRKAVAISYDLRRKRKSIDSPKPKSSKSSNSPFGRDNPFGGGGSGMAGTGNNGFGSGHGSGDGPGPGSLGDGSGRTRLTEPDVSGISSKENHKIYIRVIINAEGKVISAMNIASKTTTTDVRIINKIIAAVNRDVRFSLKPGAGNEQVIILINLRAND